jgi:hypothetical protein
LIQQIYDQISSEKGITKLDLECNRIIRGKEAEHHVDIYWRFRTGERTYSVIIEVKNYDSMVDLETLFQFKNILNDLPEQPWGVLVTLAGFQEEVSEYARRNRILLYELHKPNESGSSERITTFNITMHIYTPHFANIKFEQDVEWNAQELARLKIPLSEASKIKVEGSDNLKFFYENDNEFTTAIRLFNSLVPEGFNELAPTKIIHHFDKPTFIKATDPRIRMKLKSVEVTISKTHTIKEFQLAGENFVKFIIKSIANNTSTDSSKVV